MSITTVRSPILILLISAGTAVAIDPEVAERYAENTRREDSMFRRLGQRVARPGETERDRWVRRLDEVYTGRVPEDPVMWFDLVTVGRREWTREGSKFFAEFHQKVTQRLGLDREAAIDRVTFDAYAYKYLGSDSPPWRTIDFGGAAAELVRRFDRDRDGGLTAEESSPALRERFASVDADGSGRITADEYAGFLRTKVEAEAKLIPPDPRRGERSPPTISGGTLPPDLPDPPKVYTRGSDLPDEVPDWYFELDTDRDAQVGLYEWAADERPVEEFKAMDLNDDGLLEVKELLRYLEKVAEQAGEGEERPLKALPPGRP